MASTVRPSLARLMADLQDAWDKILTEHLAQNPDLDDYAPFGLSVTTIDGLTARFYEEGIEFYPNEKETF